MDHKGAVKATISRVTVEQYGGTTVCLSVEDPRFVHLNIGPLALQPEPPHGLSTRGKPGGRE